MQGYYRAATVAERLGCAVAPSVSSSCSNRRTTRRANSIAISSRVGPRLEPRTATLFLRRPRAMVDVFARPARSSGIARACRRRRCACCSARSPLTTTDFADDAHVLAAFLALLRRGAPAVDALGADESARRARGDTADVPPRRRPHAIRPVPRVHRRRAHAARAAQRRALRRCGGSAWNSRLPATRSRRSTNPSCCCSRRCSTTSPRAAAAIIRCSAKTKRARSARSSRLPQPTSIWSPGWCAGIC